MTIWDVKYDALNEKTKTIVRTHSLLEVRFAILLKVKDSLVRQMHHKKCILSNDNYIYATEEYDIVADDLFYFNLGDRPYESLAFLSQQSISSPDIQWFPSLRHLLDLIVQNDTPQSLFTHKIYYESVESIPESLWSKVSEYDECLTWELSCEVGLTYNDAQILKEL